MKTLFQFCLERDQKIINCYVGVSKQCKHRYNAKKIIEELNVKFSSKGGGSPTFGSSVILNQDTILFWII